MKRILKDRRFTEGLRLFNLGQFLEAHDGLEELWRILDKDYPYRDFVRGLIIVAAVYYKFFIKGKRKPPQRNWSIQESIQQAGQIRHSRRFKR